MKERERFVRDALSDRYTIAGIPFVRG